MYRLSQAEAFVRGLWRDYLESRNFFGILPSIAPEVSLIGTGEQEIYESKQMLLQGIGQEAAQWPERFKLENEWYRSEAISDTVCVVYGGFSVREAELGKEDPALIEAGMMNTRFTAVCRYEEGKGFTLCHLHHSSPSREQAEGELFPKSIVEQSNRLLKKAMEQKSRELEELNKEYRESELRYKFAMEATNDIVFELSLQTGLFSIDHAKFERMYGKKLEDDRQKTVVDTILSCIYFEDKENFIQQFSLNDLSQWRKTKMKSISLEHRILNRHKEAGYSWIQITMIPIRDSRGRVTKLIGNVKDIDDQKRWEAEMQVRSQRDSLTGLWNRAYTEFMINDQLMKDRNGVLMMIDLDDFKSINDNFGHLLGDQVLMDAAQKLKSCFRADDLVGRVGGDEFVVFMRGECPRALVEQKAKILLYRLRRHLEKNALRFDVTATIGIAVAPADGEDFHTLVEHADGALYTMKKQGKNGYHFYSGVLAQERAPAVAAPLASTQMDLSIIQNDLKEIMLTNGAYCQTYESFKRIYRFVARGLERTGQPVFVLLLTLICENGSTLPRQEADTEAERLKRVITFSLRRGDVFTRYSSTQFVVMLPGANQENARMISNRIDGRYQNQRLCQTVNLHCDSQPLLYQISG